VVLLLVGEDADIVVELLEIGVISKSSVTVGAVTVTSQMAISLS
jgi:hypothetical protein